MLSYVTSFKIICIFIKENIWSLIYNFANLIKLYSFQFYEIYLKKCEFIYRGIRITTNRPYIRPLFNTICQAPKFLNWLDKFQLDKYDLHSIEITDVDFFGSNKNPEKLGFLKYKCDVYTRNKELLDGIVFLRGDCGAVLIIVTEDESNNKYVLLTEQPRVPTGGSKEEIVAGMFDSQIGNTVVNNVLKKEIKEETGLDMDESINSVQDLGKYTLSGGGSDENVHLAVWETVIQKDKIDEMKIKQFGEQGSNEKIKLKFYPINTFEKELLRISDAKTSLAWYLYKNMKN